MACILLVEDAPDLGLYEAQLVEQEGHTVLRCSGGLSPFAACPMMQRDTCPIADAADLIIFSCGLFGPMKHRTYGGINLLRAYRSHPDYGRLPMLVVSVGLPKDLGGTGPISYIEKYAEPASVVKALNGLLDRASVPTT